MSMCDPDEREPATGPSSGPGDDALPLARPVEIPIARPVEASDLMLLETLTPARVALHLAALVVSLGIYTVILSVAVAVAGGSEEAQIDPLANLVVTLLGGVMLVLVALLLLRSAGARPGAVGLTGRKLPINLAWGWIVAVCSFGAFLLSAVVLSCVWPAGYEQLQSNPERIEEMIPALHPVWLGLLVAGICVYEEVIFRGVLLTHLRRLTRSWTMAVIIAAAIFAALHIGEHPGSQEAATCVPLFAVAIVWSLSTIWSRSLVPAMIGHFLFNMVQLAYLW